ncbi:hypothetical protein PIB30_005906 [Stylosanthes scabra]|uniref:Uncharacterized protein n=1 Tax=Stylosanthes scabra TaxID=79078 RepID=A0ABU6R587_9FABA|nr:hypothetical protein [Stylosanthes scabra]
MEDSMRWNHNSNGEFTVKSFLEECHRSKEQIVHLQDYFGEVLFLLRWSSSLGSTLKLFSTSSLGAVLYKKCCGKSSDGVTLIGPGQVMQESVLRRGCRNDKIFRNIDTTLDQAFNKVISLHNTWQQDANVGNQRKQV